MSITNAAIKRSFVQRYRWPMLLATGILLIGALAAWQYYDTRYPSWKEEVRLSDGRIITIHQKHEYYKNYGTNQSWVEIDLPELGGRKVWHSYLKPMRVDVFQGRAYVFGKPRGPRQITHYRYPENHMVAFIWTGSEFARIPFLQVPEAIRQDENVYSCVPVPKPKKLLLLTKEKTWCPASGDKGQFVRQINLKAYQELAVSFARLDGGKPLSD